jgi:hypothetical protein
VSLLAATFDQDAIRRIRAHLGLASLAAEDRLKSRLAAACSPPPGCLGSRPDRLVVLAARRATPRIRFPS